MKKIQVLALFAIIFVAMMGGCAVDPLSSCNQAPQKPFQWLTTATANGHYPENTPINFSAGSTVGYSNLDSPSCTYQSATIYDPAVGSFIGAIYLNGATGNGLTGYARPVFVGTLYSLDGSFTLPATATFDGPGQ